MCAENIIMVAFYERVKKLAKQKGVTIERLANSAGISIDSYNSYRIHDNLPRADAALKIAEALGVSLYFLLYGEGNPSDESKDNRFFVPVLDQKLSAGFGQFLPDEPEIKGYMEVPKYLRQYGDKLAILSVEGDSMEPTLRRGDMVLCDSCGYDGEGLYPSSSAVNPMSIRRMKCRSKIFLCLSLSITSESTSSTCALVAERMKSLTIFTSFVMSFPSFF